MRTLATPAGRVEHRRGRTASRGFAVLFVALALGTYGWLWLGPGPSPAGALWRERLPRFPADQDLSWWPASGFLVLATFLAFCVVATAVLDRRNENRVEPWAPVSALLVSLGIAAAMRGARHVGDLDLAGVPPGRSCLTDLAYGLCLAGAVAGLVALARIVRHGWRRHGAVLAVCALLIAPGSMWWVHVFVVAPVWAQSRTPSLDLALPVVPSARLDVWVLEERPTLHVYSRAGSPRVRVGDDDLWGAELDAHLVDVAAGMERRPYTKDGVEALDRPSDPILIRADARLPAGTVLEVLVACRRASIWKAQIATRYSDGGAEGKIWTYLPAFEESDGGLEVRSTVGGEGAALRLRYGSLESEDLDAVLRKLARDREESLAVAPAPNWQDVQVSVESTLTWQDVARVLRAVEEHGLVPWPARLQGR